MATLAEMTVQMLTARLAKKDMTLEELQKEMIAISNMIKALDDGSLQDSTPTQAPAIETRPQLTIKQAFKKDEVVCMICNKGFKTLKRHLSMAHQLKPGEYRKQFGIPSTQSLAAKSYSESRRQMALDKGLGEGLVKFRESLKAKKVAVPVVKEKANVPAVKGKASAAAKTKPPVPAVKKKAPVPAKVAKKK